MKITGVMGIEWLVDPDRGYVLTLDNMKKILAILMRFRCNIPVVIMGETGCGKTRLIQFMCSLQALQTGATNMLILKVHGGTTETDVMCKVQDRHEFDQQIIDLFEYPLTSIDDYKIIHREVDRCQQLLLDEMTVEANIAKNTALKENVFMMFVCIELKIPLFVIGKPGSSKSLAKSIISNSMQGSRCPDGSILQNFKQVQIMSYQCSQLSTADGIIGVFNSCRNLQPKTGSNKFTACVVLDEVGLAEDSPLLHLKVLHPLLEDSSYGSEEVECTEELTGNSMQIETPTYNGVPIQLDDMKDHVAFIGISNWSLDPAKMNRGIMLSRGDPDKGELITSANGICQSTSTKGAIFKSIEKRIQSLAKAYMILTSNNINQNDCTRRDYYGLRDFYSLVKMLVFICIETKTILNRSILVHAVKRNFGRVSDVDPVEIFLNFVKLPIDNKLGQTLHHSV